MKKLKPYPAWVCLDCGDKASEKAGNNPLCFICSTIHLGICGVCGEKKAVTKPRNFFYPPFEGHKRTY